LVARETVRGDRARFSLHFENATPGEPLTHLFLVYVDGARAGFAELPDLDNASGALDFAPIDIGLFPIEESTQALTERVPARLPPSRERRLASAVEACTRGNAADREHARADLARYGRFALPYLARVKTLTNDPDVLAEVEREVDRLRRAL